MRPPSQWPSDAKNNSPRGSIGYGPVLTLHQRPRSTARIKVQRLATAHWLSAVLSSLSVQPVSVGANGSGYMLGKSDANKRGQYSCAQNVLTTRDKCHRCCQLAC